MVKAPNASCQRKKLDDLRADNGLTGPRELALTRLHPGGLNVEVM